MHDCPPLPVNGSRQSLSTQLGLALGFRVSLSLVTVSATVGLTDASEAAGVPHASRARGLAACMPAAMPAAMAMIFLIAPPRAAPTTSFP